MSYMVSKQALQALSGVPSGYSCPEGYPNYNDAKGLCYTTTGTAYKSPVKSASWGAQSSAPGAGQPMAIQQPEPFYKSPMFFFAAAGALALIVVLSRKD